MPFAGRSTPLASARLRTTSARSFTASSNLLREAMASTRPHSTARLPRRPSLDGAEHIRAVAAHLALVDDPREAAAGAGQHAEQGHLGQAHGGAAVVDEQDVVAGEGEFVATAGAGTVQRRQELDAAVGRRVLKVEAGLVGEFTEVHLEGVGGGPEHVDVGAGAEDAVLGAGDDQGAHGGVLEAHALERVGELDVDAEVVAVELQGDSPGAAPVLGDVHEKARDAAVEAVGDLEAPVAVLVR